MDEKKCEVCGSLKDFIPAGVSKKTGKPYNEFWACPNKCKKASSNNTEVLAAIEQINERLDKLGKFLQDKLN